MENQSKVISAQQAAHLLRDHMTIAVSGDGEMVLPDGVLEAIEMRYLEQQRPRDLTAIFPIVLGAAFSNRGADRLSHDGLVSRVISSSLYTGNVRKFNKKIIDGKITGYHLPMSTVFRILKAASAGEKGFITKVGLGTFVDPRQEGGRMNDQTPPPISKIISVNNEEFIFYPAMSVDISIIRGTTADEYGNVSFDQEAITSGALTIAMAAKGSGGITIAQVKYLAKGASIHPKSVIIPAPLVDYIVVCPEQQEKVEICDPAFYGQIRKPLSMIETEDLNASKVIVRRAFFELSRGKMYNLGVGIPAELPKIMVEENLVDKVFFSVEHGPIGGIPFGKTQFGAAINPLAVLDTVNALEMYNGGCLDGALLGIAEIDPTGSVNVSRLSGYLNLGGFMDIVHRTPKIVFCGTFTSGGLEIEFSEAGVKIVREGRHRKLVHCVNQKSFDGARGLSFGQEAIYITERAVFKLTPQGLMLTEIGKGIDLQRDVLAQMEFQPLIADNLKTIDDRCYLSTPMNVCLG